jgi:signal recognition particle subunit SRP54
MFERLTDRFEDVFRKLSGRGTLSESNIEEAMRDVRRALLEADVNYTVARDFVATVQEKCLGQQVLKSIAPGQQAVKVVNDELTALLGEENAPLTFSGAPSGIMMVGLHGSGKTTTAAKLALRLGERDGRKVLLAACDLYRPAAIDQLETLGRELGVPVFSDRNAKDVADVAVRARARARELGLDAVIFDTAGRLQVDTDLVQELVEVKRRVQPSEILLVADAALGQESVSVAEHFDEALGITGIVLTKMDGDARGGAALSMRSVTGKPIKYVGLGEQATDLEPFYPERMASRILGMGDVVSLVERASEQFEEDEAERLEEKLRKSTFDFEDFRDQLRRLQKMGGFMSLMDMMPGMSKVRDKIDIDEGQLRRVEGIISSMTPQERRNPGLLDPSRRRRIARGCGVDQQEINGFIKRFEMMRDMMAKVGQKGGFGSLVGDGSGIPGAPGMAMGMPGRMGGRKGHATNVQQSKKATRKKEKKKRRGR